MRLSDRLGHASRLYGSGVVMLAAIGLAYVVSCFPAVAVAAALQFLLGWSGTKAENSTWLLAVLILPLPLGSLMATFWRRDLPAQSPQSSSSPV